MAAVRRTRTARQRHTSRRRSKSSAKLVVLVTAGLLVVLGGILFLTGTRVTTDERMTYAGQARELVALNKGLAALEKTRPDSPNDPRTKAWLKELEGYLVRIGNISKRAINRTYEFSTGARDLEEASKRTFWIIKRLLPVPGWEQQRAWAGQIIIDESFREPQ